ncbi:hypothetical protein HELRODRAFT_169117 [Helobdella robusta]|uniref:Uncharacterized protein n=1 Tax=Helobdella robusta TaxID=6412 RepID=T1F1F3_HELRO|nr:hypothetical protein HELRODRAFT_169117 [Helobdella robusta]ESO08312.1 hypothetical protein HELRODRAFT_169117 [Helobdella robusta]
MWRNSVVPIYKKVDRDSGDNYISISLTCVCCRLMEAELTAARTLVNNAQENETEASLLTKNVKQQFMELAELMGEGAMDLVKKKEEAAKQLQMKAIELDQANTKYEVLQHQFLLMEHSYNENLNKIKELEHTLGMEETEKQRELRKKEKLERDLKQAKDENDTQTSEILIMRSTIESLKSDLSKQQQQAKENKSQKTFPMTGVLKCKKHHARKHPDFF